MRTKILLIIIPLAFVVAGCSSNNPPTSQITSAPTSEVTSQSTSKASSESTSEVTSQSSDTSTATSEQSSIPPVTDKFFLPNKVTFHDVETNNLLSKIEYSYDSDLLGYTEIASDDETKVVRHYRYDENYSSYEYTEEFYFIENGKEELDSKEKSSFIFFENNSYIQARYIFDHDANDYAFDGNYCRMFNEFGQKVLSYNQRENPDKPGALYFSQYETFEFNSKGYPVRFEYYDYDSTPDRNKFLYAYDQYVYDDDNREHATCHCYYINDGKAEEDSYVDINYVYENGITFSKQQIYSMDGTKGNYNEFHYAANWRPIYKKYGGIPEISNIVLNEFGKIVEYDYSLSDQEIVSRATYTGDGELIVSTSHKTTDSYKTTEVGTTYSYNDENQIHFADGLFVTECKDSTTSTQEIVCNVIYNDLQNDALHEKLDYVQKIIRTFSTIELIEGI